MTNISLLFFCLVFLTPLVNAQSQAVAGEQIDRLFIDFRYNGDDRIIHERIRDPFIRKFRNDLVKEFTLVESPEEFDDVYRVKVLLKAYIMFKVLDSEPDQINLKVTLTLFNEEDKVLWTQTVDGSQGANFGALYTMRDSPKVTARRSARLIVELKDAELKDGSLDENVFTCSVIYDKPNDETNEEIGKACSGKVTIIEKVNDDFYKVKLEDLIGYMHKSSFKKIDSN